MSKTLTVALALCVQVTAAAVHPFRVQQYEKNVQRDMWWKDRYGSADSASLGLGPKPRFITQYQDHFDGSNTNTWNQAYYVNDTYYSKRSDAPIFICVGGEGPPLDGSVVVASPHCNVAVEWLQETGALMFALEHRFYGCHNASACPVSSPTNSNLRFLSSRQALGDLAEFHARMVTLYSLQSSNKWVSFGGSYPGMLAGWFRLKFPHLVHASVASSAPVRAQLDMVGYNDVTAAAYAVADNGVGGSRACTNNIASGHSQIGAMFNTSTGRATLASLFGHTAEWYQSTANQGQFAGNGVAQFPAQSNDPTCTRPGCNIEKICEIMNDASAGSTVQRLANLVKAQSAWTKPKHMLTDSDLGFADYWGYQTCTEFAFYQTCEVGSECFYTQGYVTLSSMVSFCQSEFSISQDIVARNVDYSNAYYGGDRPAGSCVLYPNGEVDPWHANSVLESPSAGIPVLMVPGASHHTWTHPSAPTDQLSVVQARETIKKYVKQFLNQGENKVKKKKQTCEQPY